MTKSTTKKEEKLEQIVVFTQAWDKRNTDPKKDYGIGAVRCRMLLKGKKGACHFIFSTGILLKETMDEYIKDGRAKYELNPFGGHYFLNKPMGHDVGYHSPKPVFEGQEIHWPTKIRKTGLGAMDVVFDKIGDKPPICEHIGVPCYCDGSALRADEFLKILTEKGSDEIWKLLEKDYKEIFK